MKCKMVLIRVESILKRLFEMNKIEKTGQWSWKYAVLRFFVKTAFCIYYRSIHISGRNNISKGGRLIFAANHQNGLMDPLAILSTNSYQPVFLARADIFKKPFIARILRFLKIMPVYRLRDGVPAMEQNEDTFIRTTSVLASGGCIGIMPEGNHSDQKRLRSLKKGIFRIAFRAEEFLKDYNQEVKIVPVGLDFSDISEFRGDLVVNYGKPISISSYLELYTRYPQKAINKIKEDLAGSLQSLMIHIKDEKNYENDKLLVDIGTELMESGYAGKHAGSYKKFLLGREFCQAMYDYFEKNPDAAEKLRSKSYGFSELTKSRNVKTGSIERKGKKQILFLSVMRLLYYPVFLAGSLLHLIPVILIHNFLKRISDPGFISTFKFVLGVLLVSLNYVGIGLVALTLLSLEYAVLLVAILPFSGLLGHRCYRFSKRLKEVLHFNQVCNKDRTFGEKIFKLKSAIVKELEPIMRNAEAGLK